MPQLRELQRSIDVKRAERGFTTDPLRLICLLVEEVGEVATEVKKTWSANYPAPTSDELANELADTFVVLSALASAFELDLEDALQTKFFAADGHRTWATAAGADS